jgi:hypothetical protein
VARGSNHGEILWTVFYILQFQDSMVNVKLSLCLTKYHTHEDVWQSGSITSHIINLSIRLRRVVSFAHWPLYHQYPLDRMLGRPQSQSEYGSKKKNSLPPLGIEPQLSSLLLSHYTDFGGKNCQEQKCLFSSVYF